MHLLSIRGRSARRWWRALLLGSAAAVAATGVPALPVLAAPVGTLSATLVAAKAVPPVVPLVTGGLVSVSAGGGGAGVLPSAARSGGGFVSYTSNGDRYLVPAAAAPYAGRQLSWSLFDVSALARDHITGPARIPVSLSFRRGAALAAPPGVRLTSASGRSARGYLTASSGREFAAWLRRRIGADIRAGRQPGSTPLPGGLAAMSLAAPAPALARGGRVSPGYPLHIVRFNATDLTGQPANFANLFVVNMDSVSRAPGVQVPVDDGTGRIAVPAGHYVAIAFFYDFDAQGNFLGGRWVTPSFSVPATSGVTKVTLAEQTATSLVSVTSTPRPATEYGESTSFQPVDARGQFVYSGIGLSALEYGPANPFGAPPAYTYVTPEPAPPGGQLRFDYQWEGVPSSLSYRYDVAFASNGVPADEAHAVRPGSLATVHQHMSTDPASPGPGSFLAGMTDPVTGEAPLSFGDPQSEPMVMTDYLGAAADGTWQLEGGNSLPYEDIYSADSQTFAPRHTYSLDWAHGPIAPVFGQHAGPGFACPACSAGSKLTLGYPSVGDSEPDHFAATPYAGKYHFTMYRDGTRVVDAGNALGVILTGVPGTAASYRVVFNSNLTGIPEQISQSTITRTDLAFRSVPHAAPGAALPAGDFCYTSPRGVGVVSPGCQILPVLTLNYRLASDLANSSNAPVQHMRLTAGHLSYDGHGSHAPITSATVAVSFDGGTTWQPAVVAGHAGHYIASWKNPASAAGTSPDLRVTATDAAGGSITQTITAAYTIAAR